MGIANAATMHAKKTSATVRPKRPADSSVDAAHAALTPTIAAIVTDTTISWNVKKRGCIHTKEKIHLRITNQNKSPNQQANRHPGIFQQVR
tara:strand:- start:446668 stop:446940 length:273 start_codon:yes stop_codon:yes gene_type:complete